MHHIISDQWSMRVFRSELATLYEAFSEGRTSPLPDPPIQFVDYASWERRTLDCGLFDNQLAYWKKQLAAPVPRLQFRKGGKRKTRGTFRISCQPIVLDENVVTGIRALGRKENVTPFMVLLAALNVLLHRYTGQKDIRIGTLVANRRSQETEGVFGHFMNTVILQAHLSPKLRVRQLLRQVRDTTLAAFAQQELPFEQLARTLEKEYRVTGSSLLQVLFSYQNTAVEALQGAGLSISSFGLQQLDMGPELTPTTFDIIVNLKESLSGLTGSVSYKTAKISEEGITGMVRLLSYRTGAHPV
jgi:hypothetical protein